MKQKTTKKLAITINILIGIMSVVSWLFMAVFTLEEGRLVTNGFSSLKFFTVLSNLFNGGVAFWYAIRIGKGTENTVACRITKLIAATAVGLTFLTVIVFLGPLFGFGSMYTGSNLWMHLILPVVSIISFVFFERGVTFPVRQTLYAILPMLFYAIGYLTNIGIHGIGEWPNTNDFYGFLTWGYGVGAIVFVIIVFVTWFIAFLLYMGGGCRRTSRS